MNSHNLMSDQRLDKIRALDLSTMLPESAEWADTERASAAVWLAKFAPVIRELVGEIDDLENVLDEAEDEVDALRARIPSEPGHPGQIRVVSVRKVAPKKWRVCWVEDGRRRSKTWSTPTDARGYAEWLLRQQQLGGGW
ncbi:hypothetical protein [Kitasatospora sp. NPDC091276]|uniref:hypothetical protein n=1 Tax=unclassified Kitasatospora TaxID=2633591 RepID=UPI0034373F22